MQDTTNTSRLQGSRIATLQTWILGDLFRAEITNYLGWRTTFGDHVVCNPTDIELIATNDGVGGLPINQIACRSTG
jgi:hypothetical protein